MTGPLSLPARTREHKAEILAYGQGVYSYHPGVLPIVLQFHDRETLEIAARLVRERLAQIETEITRRVPT